MLSTRAAALGGCALLLCASLARPAHADPVINEMLASHTGTDNTEYLEVFGPPGAPLDGLSLIAVEGEPGGAGTIDERLDFGPGDILGANGFYLVGNGEGLGLIYGVVPDIDIDLNFENGDETFALVETSSLSGGVGTSVTGAEVVVDAVALTEASGDGTFFFNAPVVGPDGTFFPAGARRVEDGVDTNSVEDWVISDFFLGPDNTPMAASGGIVINEMLISHTGVDDTEFAEVFGPPEASLDGLSLIGIESDAIASAGTIDFRLDFGPADTLGTNGFLLVGNPVGLGNNYGVTPDIAIDNNSFENSNSTYALVTTESLSGGVGSMLTGSEVGIDTVAFTDPDQGVFFFDAPVLGPDGNFLPAGGRRIVDGADTDTVDDWALANFFLNDDNTPTPAERDDIVIGNCGDGAVLIHAIQGAGFSSPLEGENVVIEGIVTGDFQSTTDGLGGFFLQEEAADEDGDDNTSEGIFVLHSVAEMSEGDLVRVAGTVAETLEMTRIQGAVQTLVCESGVALPANRAVTLPESFDGELERFEGMLVNIVSPMSVSQNFFLGRYGQMTLAGPDDFGTPGRLFQPTNLFPAGTAEAMDLADEAARRLLVLDDGFDIDALGDNPDPVPYIGPPPPDVIRAGDGISNLVGLLDQGRINSGNPPNVDYRLHPTVAPVFTPDNPRTAAPDPTGGTLAVAAFNVLNYFNGDGQGGGFPTPRGADTPSELERQSAKIVEAIQALDADVLGLIEIENDGYGEFSAIQELTDRLNAVAGAGTWDFIDPGLAQLGTDAIAVGLIYKPASATPLGDAATLATGAFDQDLNAIDGGRSRQPLVQTFQDNLTGEVFTVSVNHFKSKSPSGEPTGGNLDQGDGQGAWNLRRTEAAQDLAAWLATDPTGSGDEDVFIIGDLNAYAQEDPILAILAAGYIDLVAAATGLDNYSFTFDGLAGYLDHALAKGGITGRVSGATLWHINTDEPAVIDYNEEFNPPGYFSPDAFRASDHDPVIVGLDLALPIVIDVRPGQPEVCVSDGGSLFPIGVLSDTGFDATTLDPASIDVDGQGVRQSGSRFLARARDLDGDGLDDLLIRVDGQPGVYSGDTAVVTLRGTTTGGVTVEGSEMVCVD